MTKKIYNQPVVQVIQIAMETVILSGSGTPAPPSGDMNLNYIPTDNQW